MHPEYDGDDGYEQGSVSDTGKITQVLRHFTSAEPSNDPGLHDFPSVTVLPTKTVCDVTA